MVLHIKDAKQANQLGINWKSLFNGTEKQLQELSKSIAPYHTSRARGTKYIQKFRVATNAQKLIFNLNAQSKNKFAPKKLINTRELFRKEKIDIDIVSKISSTATIKRAQPFMHTFQSFTKPIPNNLTLSKDDTSVENSLSLKWRLCEKERYYNVYLQPTLFGGWSVVKSWGATRSKLGNYKFRVFDDLKNAHIEIEKIKKQRLARGYARVALEEIHNVTDE